MSAAALSSIDLPPPETPTSVQPGGFGVFVRLELAWGRLRRRFLRRFCKAHVERWRGKLQGDAAGSDVIDSRDLKFFRNVSPIWVDRSVDDYAVRENLGFARYGFAELVGFSAILVTVFLLTSILAVAFLNPWLLIPSTAVMFLWLEVLWFFRDPDRVIPNDPKAILSPADGTVTHVERVDEPGIGSDSLRISIFLSVFNVHGNRVPLACRFEKAQYFRGRFLDARHHDCTKQNEQLWADFTDALGHPIRVKQVSGAIARRIVCFARPGETIPAGGRYGMIKFGSRTELLIPAHCVKEVRIKVGDKVRGGVTVLARLA